MKKVLLIFSDGHDTASGKDFSRVIKELKKTDVSIFTVALIRSSSDDNLTKSMAFLEEIGKISGGKSYFPQVNADVASAVREVESILNNQYVIGYTPKKSQKEKGWHKIDVRVLTAGEKEKKIKADIITRAGYFAGEN